MRKEDNKRFSAILDGVFEVYGKERSDVAFALWIKALEPYDLAAVEGALGEHVRSSRFAPTPADVISILASRDGRPTADEAWAMIPRSEHESVCWTDEMAAAYAIAQPLLDNGDQVAARRAFIDKYQYEVAEARRQMKPAKTWFSWGWDAGGRRSAMEKAVAIGLIGREQAIKFLPAPDRAELADGSLGIELRTVLKPLLGNDINRN